MYTIKHILLKGIVLFLIILLCTACFKDQCSCEMSPEQKLKIVELDTILENPDLVESDKNTWERFNEPSLINSWNNSYRLMFENFYGYFRIYRIESTTNGYKLYVKEIDSTREPDYRDTIIKNEVHNISQKEWNEMENYLEENCFWTMPFSIKRGGLDGYAYTLEGYKFQYNSCTGKSYHRVSRWVPEDSIFISMHQKLEDLVKRN